MPVSMIAACGENHVIGKNNKLIWHLPRDLKFFKEKTLGHHVIMGRKTFESFEGTLPKRVNIVITREKNYQAPGCLVAHSLDEALEKAGDDDEPFIVGGEQIYRLALEKGMANRVYLTRIHASFEGDAFFPELDPAAWEATDREEHDADEEHAYPFSIITYERKAQP